MFLKCISLLYIIMTQVSSELSQEKFQDEALTGHNLYRFIHGVPKLTLNTNLSQMAFLRAKELAESSEINVKQNVYDGKNLGESIGVVGGFDNYNGISATQLWYSVISKFDEEGEDSVEGASFSQIVWKSTREVGFGIVLGKDGKFYFAAEYYPSGNIRGQYEENVFQLNEELLKDNSAVTTTKMTRVQTENNTFSQTTKLNNVTVVTDVKEEFSTTVLLEFDETKSKNLTNKISEPVQINATTSTVPLKSKKMKLYKKFKSPMTTVSNNVDTHNE